ncbi:MAG: replication protein [Sphingobacteriia bacterium]|nr:replication protein [Sphingobacteriia bacterium]
MLKDNFTRIPNILFDQLLRELNNSELKILLVIIRQTYGWINSKTNRRKERDRITHSQFILKTGLSRRIISATIKSLSEKNLIEITNSSGDTLINASERKGQYRIFYSSLLEPYQSFQLSNQTSANNGNNMCKKRQEPVQKVIHNKRNYYKRNLSKERIPDYKHIGEVIEKIRLKWEPKIKE